MIRARFIVVTTLVSASLSAGTTFAQAVQAPDLKPILAGKKFTPPVRGEAKVDFVAGASKREGTVVITKYQVRNTMQAPIARLKIAETWYDKGGAVVSAGEGVVEGMLQPGAVASVEVRTPIDPKMTGSKLQFTHANGAVAPSRVAKIESGDAKSEAAVPAKAKASARKK
jgi:hypothetical protein